MTNFDIWQYCERKIERGDKTGEEKFIQDYYNRGENELISTEQKAGEVVSAGMSQSKSTGGHYRIG